MNILYVSLPPIKPIIGYELTVLEPGVATGERRSYFSRLSRWAASMAVAGLRNALRGQFAGMLRFRSARAISSWLSVATAGWDAYWRVAERAVPVALDRAPRVPSDPTECRHGALG